MFQLSGLWDVPCRKPTDATRHDLLLMLDSRRDAVRAPLSVWVMLDLSFSMEGEKLAAARDACLAVWDCLGPRDHFTLVPFSSQTGRRITNMGRSSLDRPSLILELNRLVAQGVTRTDVALAKVEQFLMDDHDDDRAKLLLLVTDGNPTDANGNELSERDWLPLYETSRRLSDRGVRVTTIGLGSRRHYRRQFLSELAARGGGAFVAASDVALLSQVLREQTLIALGTSAANVELTITPLLPGLRLSDAFHVNERTVLTWQSVEGGVHWKINGGQATAGLRGQGARYLLGFNLAAPSLPLGGDVPAVKTVVTWRTHDGTTNGRESVTSGLRFSMLADDLQQQNPLVRQIRQQLTRSARPVATTPPEIRPTAVLPESRPIRRATDTSSGPPAAKAPAPPTVAAPATAPSKLAPRTPGPVTPTPNTPTPKTPTPSPKTRSSLVSKPPASESPAPSEPSARAEPSTMVPTTGSWALRVRRGRNVGYRYAISGVRAVFGNAYGAVEMPDFDLAEQCDAAEISQISPRHFEVRRSGAALFIRDLGSRFGTSVNDVRLSEDGEVSLAPNDVIRVCRVELQAIRTESRG